MFRQPKKHKSSYSLSLNGLRQNDFASLRQYNLEFFALAKFLSSPLKICWYKNHRARFLDAEYSSTRRHYLVSSDWPKCNSSPPATKLKVSFPVSNFIYRNNSEKETSGFSNHSWKSHAPSLLSQLIPPQPHFLCTHPQTLARNSSFILCPDVTS